MAKNTIRSSIQDHIRTMAKDRSGGEEREIEILLYAAELNQHCPKKDFYAFKAGDVAPVLHKFLTDQQVNQECVRVVFGVGKGVVRGVVLEELERLQAEGLIRGFKIESKGVSCVIVF